MDNCKWSPACYSVCYAVILCTIMEEEFRPELGLEIGSVLKFVYNQFNPVLND